MRRYWSFKELLGNFTLNVDDFSVIGNKTGATRLGFSVLLKIFRYEAKFPNNRKDVSYDIVRYIAKQLNLNPRLIKNYSWKGRNIKYHKAQIRDLLGYAEPTAEDAGKIIKWLYENHICDDKERIKVLIYKRFRNLKIEPPKEDRIERIAASAVNCWEEDFYNGIYNRISRQSIPVMDSFIKELMKYENVDENLKEGIVTFSELKANPGRISVDTVFKEIKKLLAINKIGLPDDFLNDVPQRLIKKYSQRAASEIISELRRHPESVRYTLLAIFFWQRGREITDNLAELLNQIIHKIGTRAEVKVNKELLRDFKKVSGKYNILCKIAEKSLEVPDGIVREVIYPVADKEILANIVKELKNTNSVYQAKVFSVMKNSYSRHYRQILPKLLDILEFRSNNETHQPVISALNVVRKFMTSNKKHLLLSDGIPIEGVIQNKWKSALIEKDKNGNEVISRLNYEMSVLQALREGLRCKEIWIVGADKFRNPEEDLPADFNEKRDEYYAELNLPKDPEHFISGLKEKMINALNKLNRNIPRNKKVNISHNKNKKNITLSPFNPQIEPQNISGLKAEIMKQWPMINLLDILKEADLQIGFTDLFQSMGVREVMDREMIQRRLILDLFGIGTNTGLKPLVNSKNKKDSYMDLMYIKRKFINKENLRNAIITVVNAIFKARMESVWGDGTASCAADSKKISAWDQNLMTEWHVRYRGPGIMIYWHVEKNSTCIYSQIKSCSSSEVSAMIEGLLRHCTELNLEKSYVDTHGQSEVGFAFTHLLGFQLLPRLKDISRKKLYLPNIQMKDQLQNLEPVLAREINWDLLVREYDQMIKYATAMRLGTAETEAIMRRFTKNNVQHPTYKALLELGKVIKTIFLCEYLDSEELRIEINEGLNVIENWNSANNFIFYGKTGEISTNNLEEQEISILCLHLLQNCLIYINTLMIQEILSKDKWYRKMTPEDFRALTPLIYLHINPYGNFELNMEERIPLTINW